MLTSKRKIVAPMLVAVVVCGAVGVSYSPLAADEPPKTPKVEDVIDAERKRVHAETLAWREANEKDKAALQGVWVLVDGWQAGADPEKLKEIARSLFLVIDGESFRVFHRERGDYGANTDCRFSVNTMTRPKKIDVTEVGPETTRLGIYTLDADRLEISIQDAEYGRPRDFTRPDTEQQDKSWMSFKRFADTKEFREQRRSALRRETIAKAVTKLAEENRVKVPGESFEEQAKRHADALAEMDRIVQAMRVKAKRELKEMEDRQKAGSEPRSGGGR
jgi:uncharacterized protein (TIGR03067 family)